jgi:membrane-associated HD superfamily phosphohydrolase
MVGLGEQIQIMANEAAATALGKEKGRLLEEFRAQIRTEAVKTIQSTIMASKEVIARQGMKELSDAHEAGVRNNYAVWMKKMEQDTESARQHMLNQVKEVSRRIEGLATSATERVQHNMETARSEAVDRFVSRLREQVAPMLVDAKDSIQKLEISQTALKKESEAIYSGLENQLEFSANESLAKVQQELEKKTAAISATTNETLSKLYQNFEKVAQDNVVSLLASLESQMTRILQERAADVSREFSTGLEGYTRSYLESIGKSIAEIPRKIPVR